MQKELIEKNPFLKPTLDFSLLIINYCEQLEAEQRYIIANQLLKSGTSIGANAIEAQNAESKADLVHKIKVAAKEADETQYWLKPCSHATTYPDGKILFQKWEEVQKVRNKILGTAKRKSSLSCFFSYFIF